MSCTSFFETNNVVHFANSEGRISDPKIFGIKTLLTNGLSLQQLLAIVH